MPSLSQLDYLLSLAAGHALPGLWFRICCCCCRAASPVTREPFQSVCLAPLEHARFPACFVQEFLRICKDAACCMLESVNLPKSNLVLCNACAAPC